MTGAPAAAARWVVVSTEGELTAIVAAAPIGPEAKARRPRDPADDCIHECMAAALLRVRRGRPVALLVTDSGFVRRLRIPAVGRISRSWTDRSGRFCFTIAGWQTSFTLDRAQSPWIDTVNTSVVSRATVVVVDSVFSGRVVFLQSWNDAATCETEFELEPRQISVITKRRANELYSRIFAKESRDPYDEGLPFRFSAAFCNTVAHAVVEALAAEGVAAGKVWAFARPKRQFVIRTTSRRTCRQAWVFHVAAIVRSSRAGGWWVLDPTSNLEAGVLSMDEWLALFGRALGRVRLTRSDAYRLVDDDPRRRILCFDEHTAGESDEDLVVARCSLACLARLEGHPPHPCSDHRRRTGQRRQIAGGSRVTTAAKGRGTTDGSDS